MITVNVEPFDLNLESTRFIPLRIRGKRFKAGERKKRRTKKKTSRKRRPKKKLSMIYNMRVASGINPAQQ
jgi:hypothetical protein